jgi:helix-turn-helix protein
MEEIFDVRLGKPPQVAQNAFSGQVLIIGFERGGERVVLFVDDERTTLERLSGLLFRRLLNGTEVGVCHPVTIGGRVTDRQTNIGEIRLTPGRIGCTGIKNPLNIDLDTIVDVTHSEKELLGRQEASVELEYVKQGVVVGVELLLNPPRKLNLLGRYLRRNYKQLRQKANALNPPDKIIRVLIRLYAYNGCTDSRAILASESNKPKALLQTLLDNGLVELTDSNVQLKMLGWVLVAQEFSRSTTRMPSTM